MDLRDLVRATEHRKHHDGYDSDVCIYHDDNHASMLIYPANIYCLACGTRQTIKDYAKQYNIDLSKIKVQDIPTIQRKIKFLNWDLANNYFLATPLNQ